MAQASFIFSGATGLPPFPWYGSGSIASVPFFLEKDASIRGQDGDTDSSSPMKACSVRCLRTRTGAGSQSQACLPPLGCEWAGRRTAPGPALIVKEPADITFP